MGDTGKVSYHDVKASVLSRIRNNTWPPGTTMPREIELAEDFGCARATVNRAMRELAEDGILDRKRKAGTRVKASPTRQAKFVIPVIREEIESTGVDYRYALVKREKPKTPDWLRARIDLDPAAEVLHLQCMHYGGNRPFQFEERWINLQAVPQAETNDFKMVGPNDWLVNEVPFTDAELTFSATNATTEIADFLTVPTGEGLFTIERTTWLDGIPVTYARLYFARGYRMTTRI